MIGRIGYDEFAREDVMKPESIVVDVYKRQDKIRINPGNIGGMSRVQEVVHACQERQIPIRIGVNSGSLEKEILAKYGAPTAEALVESAMGHVHMLEECGFDDIVISMKSSDVNTMIDAYRLCAQQCNYPLHLGVTEAGTCLLYTSRCV